jgi:restriction system protein
MDIVFHYPPELFNLVVDTIPLLCRSKKDVLLFFQGAGVGFPILEDLWNRVETDKANINKYEISRTVLTRLNSKGEETLRERREILKRITEFEEFSTCWPADQLKARGLVAQIRQVIDIKDSFTRMRTEREQERQQRIAEQERKTAEIQTRRAAIQELKRDFYPWFGKFGDENRQKRGKALEDVLNRLFKLYGISIRESFQVIDEEGSGVVEQIDGVVDLNGNLYLVEMKWIQEPVNVEHVSRHLVRIYHRGYSRGIFISASTITQPALKICRDALQRTVIFICLLEEIVQLLEEERDLIIFLKEKESAAIIDLNPFKQM